MGVEQRIETLPVSNLAVSYCGRDLVRDLQVRDSCITQLKRYLDLPNALQIRAFAQEISCVELVSAASEVVMNQFAQVAATSSDYLELDATRLGEIIASDALAVDTEQEVLDAVLKWARHDWEARKAKLPALMAKVRLPLLPPEALKDLEEDQLVAPILHAAPDGVFAAHLAEAHQWHAARAAEQPAFVDACGKVRAGDKDVVGGAAHVAEADEARERDRERAGVHGGWQERAGAGADIGRALRPALGRLVSRHSDEVSAHRAWCGLARGEVVCNRWAERNGLPAQLC